MTPQNIPSLLNHDDVVEFKRLLEAEHGKPVTSEEAREQGDALLLWCLWAVRSEH
jgi:hypothetical protein